MNSEQTVLRYANEIYSENEEMLAIYDAQHNEIERVNAKQIQAFLNNYIKTCDLEGIRRWEKIFHILPDEILDTLEYRKNRVLQKMLQQPPYTEVYLRKILTGLFGVENYVLQIDGNNYIINLTILTEDDNVYNDFISTLNDIKPCNLVLNEVQAEKYMHIYLRSKYTHQEMQQFTQGDLSQYA